MTLAEKNTAAEIAEIAETTAVPAAENAAAAKTEKINFREVT